MSRKVDIEQLFEGLRGGDRGSLAQAITLIESRKPEHEDLASVLIEKCLPLSGQSIRVAITGVPGVGKSTFIEALGMKLLQDEACKIAVLAVDPSSTISGGSILGDKTRMNELSRQERVFIRPSAAGESLGGVARNTRESMILCEAAGYNTLLIETVGVGQSEHAVHRMTDLFLLLMLPGAGDELQGIKRGIMEMADLIVVNKAEGDNEIRAKRTLGDLQLALHLFPPHENGWTTRSLLCSSLQGKGIGELAESIRSFERHVHLNGSLDKKRKDQNLFWMQEHLRYLLENGFYRNDTLRTMLDETGQMVSIGQISPFKAAKSLYQHYLETLKHD